MKLLLVLISIMTFTVDSKTKVSAAGEWPYSMEASYACTYQKGDVRANDTATLKVNGLDGITIEQVAVYLKSNKTAGAGVITMMADGTQFYRAEGTYKDWFGAYNNTDFQPLEWSGERSVNELTVQIAGTTNSLHIEKYEITWSQAPSEPHDVTLMNGTETVTTLHGTSVVLPSLPDTANWVFVGWTLTPFYERDEALEDMIAAGTYQPSADITLWAVYSYEIPVEQLTVTDMQDGAYIYADMHSQRAMSGSVYDGEAGAASIDLQDLTQYYEVQFDLNGKAIIRRMYVYGEEYIGFSDNTLTNAATPWEVYHEGDKTAFYTMYNNKVYMLYPNILKEPEQVYMTGLHEVNDITIAETALLQTDHVSDVRLTCYPQVPFGVENVQDARINGEWVISFGNYELVIRNGNKYLRLK